MLVYVSNMPQETATNEASIDAAIRLFPGHSGVLRINKARHHGRVNGWLGVVVFEPVGVNCS